MGVVRETILKHPGAILDGRKWCCQCKADLELPTESLVEPTAQQIVDAWAEHLAGMIIKELKRARLLPKDA